MTFCEICGEPLEDFELPGRVCFECEAFEELDAVMEKEIYD